MPMSSEEAETFLNGRHADAHNTAICENEISSQEIDLMIIVPIYGVEDTLERCIDSILNQKTKYNFKIVAVNDGSPDRCGEILKKYESNDKVIVHTQENQGHAGARNTGLKNMFAKYVAFVDSDDDIPEDHVELMLDAAFKHDADVVEGCMIKRTLDGKLYGGYRHEYDANASKVDLKGFPCGKLFRAELFRYVHFPFYWFEDSTTTMLVVAQAKRVVTIPNIIYYYVTNPNGICNASNGKIKSVDTFYVTRALLADQKTLMDKGLYVDYKVERMFEQIAVNWQRTFVLGIDIESSIFVLSCDMFNKYFPNVENVPSRFAKLYKSLKERDFALYRRECAFI